MLIERAKNSTSFPLLMLTLSIQGFVIAAQFGVSLYLSPEALGTIRMFESLFSILLLTCLWGVPTLVFREAALTNDKSGLCNLFYQSIRAPIFVASIVLFSTILLLIFKTRYIFNIALESVVIMAGLVYLSSPTRISTAILQGGGIVKIYWFRIFLAAIAGTLIIVVATFLYGENGWIFGRFLAEALILAVTFSIYWAVRIKSKSIVCLSSFRMRQLMKAGAVINAALIVRTLCENIPIILLKQSSIDSAEVGYFGVATLWMFFPTLILAIYAQRETPKLIADFFNLSSFNSRLKNNLKQILLISLVSVIFVGVIFILTCLLVLPKYTLAIPAFLVLLTTIPLRAVTLVAGILFIAREQYKKSMFLNLFELLIILFLGVMLDPESAISVAWICFSSSIISTAISLKLIADQCSLTNLN